MATLVAVTLVAPAPALAGICALSAERAAANFGVPADLLRAIARIESGTGEGALREGNPFAVNDAGRALHFDGPAEALAHLRGQRAAGRRDFDVGCFQINYRWHADRFARLEEMLDPERGAEVAAEILREHHDREGDWLAAAGAYHSRTPAFAQAYLARLGRALSAAPQFAGEPVPAAPASRRAPPAPLMAARAPLFVAAGARIEGGAGPLMRAGGPLLAAAPARARRAQGRAGSLMPTEGFWR